MKKVAYVFVLLLLGYVTMAQDENEFSCQIVLNIDNQVVPNKKAIVQISVLQDVADGPVVYTEKHTVKTDSDGMVNFVIGQGDTKDDFNKLELSAKTYYAKIETTVSGATLSEPPVLLCKPLNNQYANTSNAQESQQYVTKESIDSIVSELQKKIDKVREVVGESVYHGHEYVDLGLPSGTLWATTNVGAFKPEDPGYYLAWGETEPKEEYNTLKYRTFGFDDPAHGILTTLDLPNDAASVCWGGRWVMPTKEQQDELINYCYWAWTNDYNNSKVSGYIVFKAKDEKDKGAKANKHSTTSYTLDDAHIFLPAGGIAAGWDLWYVGMDGYYWSSSRVGGVSLLLINSKHFGIAHKGRIFGCSVRPVCPAIEK